MTQVLEIVNPFAEQARASMRVLAHAHAHTGGCTCTLPSPRPRWPAGSPATLRAKQQGAERIARSRQREMIRLEIPMQRSLQATYARMNAEVVRRTAAGQDPTPLDCAHRWSGWLYEAQIKPGMASAVAGWDAGTRLLASKQVTDVFPLVGVAAGDDFLRSPTSVGVKDYFKKTSVREAGRYAKRVDEIFQEVKLRESINPETGRPNLGGLNMGQIAEEMKGRLGQATDGYARMIARTGVVWANNEGAMGRYKADGIEQKEWFATEDELLCPFCAEMDGTIIGIDDSFAEPGSTLEAGEARMRFPERIDVKHPPLHPNCRCVLLPAVKAEGEETEPQPEPEPQPQPEPEPQPQPQPQPIVVQLPPAPKPAPIPVAQPAPLAAVETEAAITRQGMLGEFGARSAKLARTMERNEARIEQLTAERKKLRRAIKKVMGPKGTMADAQALDQTTARLRVRAERVNRVKASLQTRQKKLALEAQQKYLSATDPITKSGLDVVILEKKHMNSLVWSESQTGMAKVRMWTNRNVPLESRQVPLIVRNKRAFYSQSTITASQYDSASTIVHEMGHHIEASNPELGRRVKAIRDAREATSSVESLRKAYPGQRYESNEVFKRDKWREHGWDRFGSMHAPGYAGKQYGNSVSVAHYYGNPASEVISLGMQRLLEDPVGFARQDPEIFDLLLNALRGKV